MPFRRPALRTGLLAQTTGTYPALQAQLRGACSTMPCPGHFSLKCAFSSSYRGTVASTRVVLSTKSPSIAHISLLLTSGRLAQAEHLQRYLECFLHEGASHTWSRSWRRQTVQLGEGARGLPRGQAVRGPCPGLPLVCNPSRPWPPETGSQSVQWAPRHTPDLLRGEVAGHTHHGARWSLLGSGERPGTWWRPEPGGTGAKRRQEAGVAGVLGGGGTCRLGNRPGELGPREVSSYEAGIFLIVGEAWLRGIRGRGWLGLCREELKEGWREWGSGYELPARVGVGRGAGNRAGALQWLEAPQSQCRRGGYREEAAAFSRGGRGFPAAEHQPGGWVSADAVRTCPPATRGCRGRELTISMVPPCLGLRGRGREAPGT